MPTKHPKTCTTASPATRVQGSAGTSPEAACNDQPRNFFAYLATNLLSKISDEIASAELVIPWLFGPHSGVNAEKSIIDYYNDYYSQ